MNAAWRVTPAGEQMAKSLLAKDLSRALKVKRLSADALAERTKVPRGCIGAFLAESEAVALPELVYLKGHLKLVCRELGLDAEAYLSELDAQYGVPEPEQVRPPPRWWTSSFTRTTAAGVGAIALLAIVMAAASSIG